MTADERGLLQLNEASYDHLNMESDSNHHDQSTQYKHYSQHTHTHKKKACWAVTMRGRV